METYRLYQRHCHHRHSAEGATTDHQGMMTGDVTTIGGDTTTGDGTRMTGVMMTAGGT